MRRFIGEGPTEGVHTFFEIIKSLAGGRQGVVYGCQGATSGRSKVVGRDADTDSPPTQKVLYPLAPIP